MKTDVAHAVMRAMFTLLRTQTGGKVGVGKSADATRTSACATSTPCA